MTFWRIATTALLVLTWSLPALATDRDRREERDDVRIERLAHELAESARHIDHQIRDARRWRHGHHYRDEWRAVRAVHELKDAAKHFHKVVERSRGSAFHLSRDLDRVAHAYQTAVYRVERAHLFGHVERDLKTVGRWIDRISDRYEASSRNARYDVHARYAQSERYTRGYGKQSDPPRGFWSVSWQSPRHNYRH